MTAGDSPCVAARVLANTRAQGALIRPDALTSALRDVVTEIMVSDWGNRYFDEMVSGVALCWDLGDPRPEVGTQTADFFGEGRFVDGARAVWFALTMDRAPCFVVIRSHE